MMMKKTIVFTILVIACLQLFATKKPLKSQTAHDEGGWNSAAAIQHNEDSDSDGVLSSTAAQEGAIQEDDSRERETTKRQLDYIQEFDSHVRPTTPNNTTAPIIRQENNSTIAAAIPEEDSHDEVIVPTPTPAAIIQNDSREVSTPSQPKPQPQQALLRIPLNGNSTIASDIVQIWHAPDSKEICVELKQDARCPHPDLVGRLSGPSLAILEWNERRSPDADAGTTVLCGGYDHYWLDAGDYFVEIVILHCRDFGVNALKRKKINLTAWLEADNEFECPEDAKRNVITSKDGGATIRISASIEGRGNYRLGRWVRKPNLPSRPLFVRYQPHECFEYKKDGSPLHLYCDSITERDLPTNGTGLYEYEFQWHRDHISKEGVLEKLRQRLGDNNTKLPKVCGLGDSHTRYMKRRTTKQLQLKGIFKYCMSYYPNPEGIRRVVRRFVGDDCDLFFSQVAQWPASHFSQTPWTFGRFYEYVKLHIKNVLIDNPNATFYMPANDKNPLMYKIINCTDWRLSTYLDAYSHVTKRAIQELNTELNTTTTSISHHHPQVRYLDIDFIIYPHWDGAPDWQHLSDQVRIPKTLYMLGVMLGEIEWSDSDREMSTLATTSTLLLNPTPGATTPPEGKSTSIIITPARSD